MPFSTFKTTNASYWPLVTGIPAWKLSISANPWDDLMDALDTQNIFAPAYSSAYMSAGQSISNNALTALNFNTNLFDVGGVHSTTTNINRFTAPSTGLYLCIGCVVFAANTSGTSRTMSVRKNGSVSSYGSTQVPTTGGSDNVIVNFSALVNLTAGDYVEFMVFQDSGGALTTGSGAGGTIGSITRVS